MQTKTKTTIAAGVAAVGVATAALFGLNTTDETATQIGTTQSVTTPIVETYEEQTEVASENETTASENSISVMSLDNEETDSTAAEEVTETEESGTVSDSETVEDETESDLLAPYRRETEKDGVIIYYYEDVPPELIYLLFEERRATTWDLRNPVTVTGSDISIMNEFIFIQSANGLLYLSQISNDITTDEQITNKNFKGYSVYLNQSVECSDWLPFKEFAGSFYGNGNSIYIMTVSEDVSLTIDNMFADSFTGRLEGLTIVCNSGNTPLINNADGAYFYDVTFDGNVTYLIKEAYNCTMDKCETTTDYNCIGVIKNADSVTVKNTHIKGNMKTALLETASGACVIENNIVASTIQGEPESRCGAYVGTLKNEIVLKNNLSQCTIDVPMGYGGHAIGYAGYDYKDCENMSGNYFESSLTVEGELSTRFIGNIDFTHIIPVLYEIDNFDFSSAAVSYNIGGVATTVYNLGLFPDGLTLEGETEEIKLLREKKEKQADYTGYYEEIDIAAINQTAKLNGNTQIISDENGYYFEEPEAPDYLAIENATYQEGNVIIFLNQIVEDKTAIVTTYAEEEKMLTMSITEITGKTNIVEIPENENITRIKVMIWDSVGSMLPLCEAFEKGV